MAVIKSVTSRASIGKIVNYVTKDEKTEEKLISGIECTPSYAIDEMKATKAVWNKTEGRQYKHFVQSFSPEEIITPEQAHKLAFELCESHFKGFEVLIATHKDKDHIHSHIIVNSVSHENGRKFQQSKADLQRLKDRSDELCEGYNLSICEKGESVATYGIDKYRAIGRALDGNYKSYVLDTAKSFAEVMKRATSRENFKALMKEQGYETVWEDNLKYITFTDKAGNKVRNSNIQKTFKFDCEKESLENEFCRNSRERQSKIEGAGESETKQVYIDKPTRSRTEQLATDRATGANEHTYGNAESISTAEQSGVRKQPSKTSIGDIERKLREVVDGVKQLTSEGRAEQAKRQRAEPGANKGAEQQRQQSEECKPTVEPKHGNDFKGPVL